MVRGSLRPVGLVALLCACGGTTALPASPETPPEATRTEQAHLLLFPLQDGESLLGRQVKITPDGAWTIADTRAPGCEVRAKLDRSEFTVRRQVDVQSLSTVSAGLAQLISLEGRFGRANKADIEIKNTAVLRAETRGPCGSVFIDTVFLGRGTRKLIASSQIAGGVSGRVGIATPGVTSSAERSVVDETSWSSDQAYGFSYKETGGAEPLGLAVDMPSSVTEGEAVQIKITTTKTAYLVAYYVDADGRGDVLWPSNEEPLPMATPDRPAILPSERERAQGISIRAQLKTTGTAARETLAVYAFSEKSDFERLAPGANGNSADGAAYAAELTAKLESVPFHRWSRSIASYRILPRTSESPKELR